MQETNTNKTLLRYFYEAVYQQWNMRVADKMLAPDFVSHDWPDTLPRGPQGFRNYYDLFRKAMPDARYEVDDLIAEDNKVVVRWRMLGTHLGIFPGIDIVPTGRSVELKGVAIYRLEDKKLKERWVVSDLYGLLKEIR